MSQEGNQEDRGKGLNSTEYRHRLLNKLNCLIAVLEVAIGKVSKSLESDDANYERLVRIRANLENTLAICRRAKSTLETKLGAEDTDATPSLPSPAKNKNADASFRTYVELSSIDEFRKFKSLPPIQKDDVEGTDLDELVNKLLNNEE